MSEKVFLSKRNLSKDLSVIGIVFLVSSSFVLSITGLMQVVKADGGSVYIRADGSIDPLTAPISTIDNVTYTLAGNISDGIVIERDNIVLDGAGYTVQGIGGLYWPVGVGVSLTGRANDTVENVNVNGFGNGIELYLCYVGNNSIVGNNITNNGHGIHCETVYNDNRISGNNITNNGEGIFFWHASNNSIIGNNIKSNEWDGIYLRSSQDNTISQNNIEDNGIGINTEWDRSDIYSVHNKIYGNNFVNNSMQVRMFEPVPNVWDDGYPSGGNYWSDYSARYPNAAEIDHSGLWNSVYVIDANNKDNYPLMPTYAVTIDAYCDIEGTGVAVSITEDVSATGYTTPHAFNSLRGSYTFAVPNTDTSNHRFLRWSTGQTSTVITVSSAGTHTAYYSRSILRSDLDGNDVVNIVDLSIAAQAFQSKPGDLNWNPVADLDNNGIINILDITIVAKDFGRTV